MNKKQLFQKISFAAIIILSLQSFNVKSTLPEPIDKTVNVTYVGYENQYFIFKLNYVDNSLENGKKMSVKILADNNEVFYNQYKEDKIEKVFKINNADVEKISFEVVNKNKIAKRFEFAIKTAVREEIMVNPIVK